MTGFFKKHSILLLVLSLVLVAAMALSFVACDKDDEEKNSKKEFIFTVEFPDGTSKEYTVITEKNKVGDALIEQGLLDGEEGPYGLYVKAVDGISLDYSKDGAYWAFYINGEYAVSGVDTTTIEEGCTYTFKAESAD